MTAGDGIYGMSQNWTDELWKHPDSGIIAVGAGVSIHGLDEKPGKANQPVCGCWWMPQKHAINQLIGEEQRKLLRQAERDMLNGP